MSARSRRGLLRSGVVLGVVALAGCAGRSDGSASSETAAAASTDTDCTATEPPKPTGAATGPRSYPERPATLSADTVEPFVEAYETAYQYNTALAEDPRKVGRLNELEVAVSQTAIEYEETGFTAAVSGNRYYRISTPSSSATATPTVTPLPMGRQPFSASYVVTPTVVRRAGVTVECW